MCQNQRGSSAIGTLILLILILGTVGFLGTNHLVMTREGLKTYRKSSFTLSEVYVDMTSTSVLGLRHFPRATSAMVAAGDARLLPGGKTLEALAAVGGNVMEAVRRFDSEGEIAENVLGIANETTRLAKNSAKKYQELDAKYDITGKSRTAVEGATSLAEKGLAGLNRLLENKH